MHHLDVGLTSLILIYISRPHPPFKGHQKLTQESKLFNVNDYQSITRLA